MLSKPSINSSIDLQHSSLGHESYIEQYVKYEDFKDVYEKLVICTQVEEFIVMYIIT